MTPPPDLSLFTLILHADPVVKAVMAALALASVASWAIIAEKLLVLSRLGRGIAALRGARATGSAPGLRDLGLAAAVLGAGIAEGREGREPIETLGAYRQRLEHAMGEPLAAALRAAEPGLPFLASVGAVAPFIGLFGTVWGIMNSFGNIARSADTSLAVVAPGIAEALFATAIGLAAAIPAVLGYNRLGVRLARLRQEGAAAIAAQARALAGRARES